MLSKIAVKIREKPKASPWYEGKIGEFELEINY